MPRRLHGRTRILALLHPLRGDLGVVERHVLRGEWRAAVDQQGVPFPPTRGDKLVHDTARGAAEGVLAPLADEGLLGRVDPQAVDRLNQGGGGHLQRRRRRQPAPQRYSRQHDRVKPAPARRQLRQVPGHHAAHVVGPVAGRSRLERRIAREGGDGATHPAIGRAYPAHRRAGRPRRDDRVPVDAEGHHEALVVVGVLADEVDSAGRADHHRRLPTEDVGEQLLGLLDLLGRHGSARGRGGLGVRAGGRAPPPRRH
eukprot:scaffold30091_cov101-Isochrysis_galbana.AAC.1